MIQDDLKLKGRLDIVVTAEDGTVKQRESAKPVVTCKGYVASRMKDASASVMSHMSIGTGTTAAAAGNTASYLSLLAFL